MVAAFLPVLVALRALILQDVVLLHVGNVDPGTFGDLAGVCRESTWVSICSLGLYSVSVHNIRESYDVIAIPSTAIVVIIPSIGRDEHVVDGA